MYYLIYGSAIYFFILTILVRNNKKVSDIFGILILTLITFSFGLRYGVGIDYFNYEEDFNHRYNIFTFEYIYFALRYLIKTIFDEFAILTFVMMFITNYFLYLGLKKRNLNGVYLILAIIIYLSNSSLIFMNLMRQGVAVAIFFYASSYIRERNFKKYLCYILLGAGFHLSVLALLPLYFIKFVKLPKIKYLISIILCYFLVYFQVSQSLINFFAKYIDRYSKYYNHDYIINNDVNILSFGVLINIVFLLIIVFNSKIKENIDIAIYYMIGTCFNVLALSSFMFDRIGIYFFIFGALAIPKLIEGIKNRNLRRWLFILAIVIATVFYVQSVLINPESLKLEYRSIFD